MTPVHILVFALAAVPYYTILPTALRGRALIYGSLLAMFWLLADSVSIRLTFLLGVAAIALVYATWLVTNPRPTEADQRTMWGVGIVLMAVGIAFAVMSRQWLMVGAMGLVGVSALYLPRPTADVSDSKRNTTTLIALILVIFALLKYPPLAQFFGESLTNAESITQPIMWVGFSYFAFRLLALIFDSRAGRLPAEGFSLRETLTYALFFPAYTAGPIDRPQPFMAKLPEQDNALTKNIVHGVGRIGVGMFKKFIVADLLALIPLSSQTLGETQSTMGLWVLLYVYTFRIFLDFSGYSDIAIGLGQLYGIKLPENFDRPYLKPNIQQFWQSWHITLSTWFRIYFFTPFSRMLVTRSPKPPQWVIVLLAQLSTMLLIGLWHGISLNFVVWGLWHGVGLFGFKMISDRTRGWHRRVTERQAVRRMFYGGSVLITFHFVAVAWLYFALPDVTLATETLLRMFGVR